MITIITINLNNRIGLQKTIESVVSQTYFDRVRYIIIDGGSTDGSRELIESHQDKLYHWVSESDSGLYNAMNKGIDAAPDEGYMLFLNSGDYLCANDVLEKIWDELDCDIVYGNEFKVHSSGSIKLSEYPDKLDEAFFHRTALPHQSTFIRASLQKANKYSEDYKLLGDWKFFREMIMVNNVTYKHIRHNISVYGLDGLSTINRSLHNKEKSDYYAL